MFTVLVTIEVRPGREAEFEAGIRANAAASLHDEPGCLRFDVHRLTGTGHRYMLHEVYADADAFHRAHRSAPHYTDWLAVVDRCVLTKTNVYGEPL